jgi:hypothetical protein
MQMKKFMALYMAPAAAIAEVMKATPDEMKAEMNAWYAWQEKHKASIVDFGAPLGRTKRVTPGGISDSRNEITGYALVQGDSAEDVAKIFTDHPHLKIKGASVDLLDWVDINAMMPA